MNRLSLCAGLALLAGCASAPQTETPQAAAQLGYTAAPAQAATDQETAGSVVVAAQVDAQDVHPGSQVVCRDMLQHASNVLRTRCMTVDGWKRYEAAEEQRAQALLRSWQGSAYAGY